MLIQTLISIRFHTMIIDYKTLDLFNKIICIKSLTKKILYKKKIANFKEKELK